MKLTSVVVGAYTISEGRISPSEGLTFHDLAEKAGLTCTVSYSGARTGYGHGQKTITLANPDGSLVYRVSYIDRCEGPGYRCSYDHGPWREYGVWRPGCQ